MKKSKFTIVFAAMLALCICATVLFGCGGVRVGARGDNGKANVLTVGIAGDQGENTAVSTVAQPFQDWYFQKTGEKITVKTTRIGNDYMADISKLYNAKNLPNVIQVYDYASDFLTDKNMLKPITDKMAAADSSVHESDIVPSVLSFMKSGKQGDDNVYWMSRDYNRVTVMYNTEIFDIAEVSYPQTGWTWSDFLSVCAQLKAKEADIKKATGKTTFYAVDLNANFEAVYYPAIRSYGGDLYDIGGTNRAFKNEQAVKDAMTTLYNVIDEGYSMNPSSSGNYFATGEAAMYFCVRPNVPGAASHLRKQDGSVPIDFVVPPAYEADGQSVSYVGMGCTGYGISTSCPENKTDLAWAFLQFVGSKAGQEALSRAGAIFPMRTDMMNSASAFNKYLEGKNHAAFYESVDGVADLPMNFLKGFNVSKHNAIYTVIKKNAQFTSLVANKNSDTYYNNFRSALNAALN